MSKSLVKQFKKYMDSLPPDSPKTIDDFYDSVNIEPEYRTDFGTAALVKQYYVLCDKQAKKQTLKQLTDRATNELQYL